MRVDLGADVYGSDGSKLGTVDRIVLDSENKQVHKIVVHKGLIEQHNKLVDVVMIERQDDRGLYLDLNASQFDELPDFVEERFVQVPQEDYDDVPFILPNAAGAGAYLYGAPYMGRGYEGSQDSFFDAAPATAPVVSDRSNIPNTDIMIDEGTNVIGSDGEKVGSVDEIFFDGSGNIAGFVVKAGTIFTHDVRIPIDWVADTNTAEIRLKISSNEAESRSRNAGGAGA